MERRIWMSPKATVEQFVANEYVAACGDSGAVYKFECNAPAGTLYYYKTSDGCIDGNYTGTDSAIKLGGYRPCSKKHEAGVSGAFYDGFIDYNRNNKFDDGEQVIVWLEMNGNRISNYHATKELDMNSWEIAKS